MAEASENYYESMNELLFNIGKAAGKVTSFLYKIRQEEEAAGVPVEKMSVGGTSAGVVIRAPLLLVSAFLESSVYAGFKKRLESEGYSMKLEIQPIVGAFREEDFSKNVKCLEHVSGTPQITYENPDCELLVAVEVIEEPSVEAYVAKTANELVKTCTDADADCRNGLANGHNGEGLLSTFGEIAQYFKSTGYGIMLESAKKAGYHISVAADTKRAEMKMYNEDDIVSQSVSSPQEPCHIVVLASIID